MSSNRISEFRQWHDAVVELVEQGKAEEAEAFLRDKSSGETQPLKNLINCLAQAIHDTHPSSVGLPKVLDNMSRFLEIESYDRFQRLSAEELRKRSPQLVKDLISLLLLYPVQSQRTLIGLVRYTSDLLAWARVDLDEESRRLLLADLERAIEQVEWLTLWFDEYSGLYREITRLAETLKEV